MRRAELGNGRDLFHDVVAEIDIATRHMRARVTSVYGDRFRRIDEYAGRVVLIDGHRNCVIAHVRGVRQQLKLFHEVTSFKLILAVCSDHVKLYARVIMRRDDQESAGKVFVNAPAIDTHTHTHL